VAFAAAPGELAWERPIELGVAGHVTRQAIRETNYGGAAGTTEVWRGDLLFFLRF
jgi:hypothetical protein